MIIIRYIIYFHFYSIVISLVLLIINRLRTTIEELVFYMHILTYNNIQHFYIIQYKFHFSV